MDIMQTECSQEFIEMINQTTHPTILDYGCGQGFRLFEFLEKCKNLHAIGIDISLPHLMGALRDADLRKLKNRVDFVQGDVNLPPFRENIFSHVLIVDILYILPSLNAINKLPRVINSGGLLFIVEKTFNPAVARSLHRIVKKHPIKFIINESNCSFHGNYHLTKKMLKQRLQQANFKIMREEYITYLPVGEVSRFHKPLKAILNLVSWINKRHVKSTVLNRMSIGIALLCEKSRKNQCIDKPINNHSSIVHA